MSSPLQPLTSWYDQTPVTKGFPCCTYRPKQTLGAPHVSHVGQISTQLQTHTEPHTNDLAGTGRKTQQCECTLCKGVVLNDVQNWTRRGPKTHRSGCHTHLLAARNEQQKGISDKDSNCTHHPQMTRTRAADSSHGAPSQWQGFMQGLLSRRGWHPAPQCPAVDPAWTSGPVPPVCATAVSSQQSAVSSQQSGLLDTGGWHGARARRHCCMHCVG
jgi:hypothetical protein